MITRRFIRIKILQVIFSYLFSEDKSIDHAEKELFFSIDKFYDLYVKLLYFIVDLKKYAENKIETALNKKVPAYEDLHPNTKFVKNRVIKQIEENEHVTGIVNRKKLGWALNHDFLKDFYNQLIQYDFYKDYMSNQENSYNEDKTFIIKIYRQFLPNYEPLYSQLEEQSIYWNDEVELVISFVIKTIKNLNKDQDGGEMIFPLFRNEEDREFAEKLLKKAIINYSEYDELIKKNSQNWDLERIAFMDILIMKMAVTEMLEFTSIPTKVTLDEYIEIAKHYSTEKSNVFINGILDKIISQLRSENRIHKQGRGLIGEV